MRYIKLINEFINEGKTSEYYTMYSGIDSKSYDKFWRDKSLLDKLTNVTSEYSTALDFSYNFETGEYEDLVFRDIQYSY